MYKQQRLISTLILSAALFFLAGCWKQHDVISISSNGDVTFESEVIITGKDLNFNFIEELSGEFIKELVYAGWKVNKKWLSRKEPFKLLFSGSGNLKQVGSADDFYNFNRTDKNKIQIRFRNAESKGGKSSRSIVFQTSMLRNDAIVLDPDGKPVSEIKNVSDSKWYTIILE